MSLITPIAIGQTGENWRDYINLNFQNVTKYTRNEMLCLTTEQIDNIPSDYISIGKRAYDITMNNIKRWNGIEWIIVPDITVGKVQPNDGIWLEEVDII